MAVACESAGCVVLAVALGPRSPLQVGAWLHDAKLASVSPECALLLAGVAADGRLLAKRARARAVEHWFQFDEAQPVAATAADLAELCASFSRVDDSDDDDDDDLGRPLGCAALVCGLDGECAAPVVHHVQPSGAFRRWRAKAIGDGAEAADAVLDAGFTRQMPLADAVALAERAVRAARPDASAADLDVRVSLLGGDDDAAPPRAPGVAPSAAAALRLRPLRRAAAAAEP